MLFKSITGELNIQKEYFKLSGPNHRLTSGEWKETVLKKIISRHLPQNIGISSGFISFGETTSTQIDILLYDLNIPILFKDDEKKVVIVPPDSVKGIIEVKTALNLNDIEESIIKLYDNVQKTRNFRITDEIFAGIFAYETNIKASEENLLKILHLLLKYSYVSGYVSNINHLSLGKNIFIKFWYENPLDNRDKVYYYWHAYELQEKAPAYFVMNTVVEVSGYSNNQNSNFLFPKDGKEGNLIAKLRQIK